MAKIRQLSAQALRDMRRAIEMREKAIAMREQALDTRLRVWLNRLNTHQKHTQDCALQLAVDAALSVASADYANIQLIDPRGCGLILKAQRGSSGIFSTSFKSLTTNTPRAVWP